MRPTFGYPQQSLYWSYEGSISARILGFYKVLNNILLSFLESDASYSSIWVL